MSVASISAFLQHMASVDLAGFGQRISLSEWKILLALGQNTLPDRKSEQSYKALKCTCALSDDGLSRGLRRLVALGLIERESSGTDQRVTRYHLSSAGQEGILKIGRATLQQLGQLVIAVSLPEATDMGGVGE